MAEAAKNRLAAQLIRAEMLGDQEKVTKLRSQLNGIKKDIYPQTSETRQPNRPNTSVSFRDETKSKNSQQRIPSFSAKSKKFLESTTSLSQMFEQEKAVSVSDEVKMFLKTSSKFTRDDMETKYFSQEIDDSQTVLNQAKRHKIDNASSAVQPAKSTQNCDKCIERIKKHLVIDRLSSVYLSLTDTKPFLSSMSNIIIRNIEHSAGSFLYASNQQQLEVEQLISRIRSMYNSKGYRCLIMETFFKDRQPSKGDLSSGAQHFQINCLPIKEKHFERSRMSFKQALQDCEGEWSMNKKLIVIDEGFGHVIEHDREFSRNFGLEVLSGLLDKDFNSMRLNQHEEFREQFERCRDFKLIYSKYRD